MRLPDFHRSVDFADLRRRMGVEVIPLLPPVKFERVVETKRVTEEVDEADRALLEALSRESIEVAASEIVVEHGLLTHRGRKVAAYIRDQRQGVDWGRGTSKYRFHLADCGTLEWMREAGRERRYLATRRKDGRFEVRQTGWYRRSGVVKLELCQNCRALLRSSGRWFEPFTLAGFLERFDSSVPRTIRREEVVKKTQEYQPEQADLAREYKKAVNHRCQACSVDCTGEKGLLHLHHRDGDPSNNYRENLAVLCVDCHSMQPMHEQVRHHPRFHETQRRIRALRSEQGIVDSWPGPVPAGPAVGSRSS